jgi:endoglucanase
MKALMIVVAVVTCGFCARAASVFVPSNPPEMKPLPHDTPAYRAAKLFMHGMNISGYITPPGARWAIPVTTNDFVAIKREGFDHVRVPVAWHYYAGPAPDYTLSPEIFALADFAVTNGLANHLAVLINIHNFKELNTNPPAMAAEFFKLWEQIAAHYKDFPDELAFELDNEPHAPATTAVMNRFYAQLIPEIRKTNPHRTIFVEPGNPGQIEQLKNLVLPPDDNVIVSVHCYEPFYFTHQGATFVDFLAPLHGVVFPGPPAKPLALEPSYAASLKPWVRKWIQEYNTMPAGRNPSSALAFADALKLARQWSDYYGRPVHIGEFGCNSVADAQSRVHYHTAMRRLCDQQQLGWAVWGWTVRFSYWDSTNNVPMPGLHEALFGN